MISSTDAQHLVGATAYDESGSKLGTVGQFFLDDQSGRPEFITVSTGLFGTRESFVPVAEATVDDDSVTVPFAKDQVKEAPTSSSTAVISTSPRSSGSTSTTA
jgi:sporulation protein YlmC with PRC-barrel domain